MTYDPALQVTVRPGMSGGVHAVNIVLSVLSCGAWLYVYALWALASPAKVAQVYAPAGTPQHVIDEARRQAVQLSPAEKKAMVQRNWTIGVLMAAPPLLFLGWTIYVNATS
jgi:hypothetical protein